MFLSEAKLLYEKKRAIAAAMCLSISIQSAPSWIVIPSRLNTYARITQPLASFPSNFCAENQLLDALLSLIVACENAFLDIADECIAFLLAELEAESSRQAVSNAGTWQKKKLLVDILITMSVVTPSKVTQHSRKVRAMLTELNRKENVKDVRDSTKTALQMIDQLNLHEKNHRHNVVAAKVPAIVAEVATTMAL